VHRAYSHWAHQVASGVETLSFEDAIAAEPERVDGEHERMLADPDHTIFNYFHFSYLARGRYAQQLEPWLDHFTREQILVLTFDDLVRRPWALLRQTLSFLELSDWRPRRAPALNQCSYEPLQPTLEQGMRHHFVEDNARLEHLIGRSLGW